MLDDLFSVLVASSHPHVGNHLVETNTSLGFNRRNDLTGALGAEMTLALDGALLPTPW